ncbi:DP-EP family protein [Alteromonas pelagimontana]|uniref:DP-EP family protein n=1 Tax=Alteromonas pelagimontana TaxID=1858656 RepID=A0A6M4MAK2_9ALTE|nr:DP-EP family protein [Alteromonas pelagimontana]QJR79838.1 DP-EP family protein [Alteromonas pelagimontana]
MTGDAQMKGFTVAIKQNGDDITFDIKDEAGNDATAPIQIDAPDTTIEYSLINNNDEWIFCDPKVEGDDKQNLQITLGKNKQQVIILDSDADNEDICLRLVVARLATPDVQYTSPDPQIKNKPEN